MKYPIKGKYPAIEARLLARDYDSIAELAYEHGVSARLVYQVAHEIGLKKPFRRLTPAERYPEVAKRLLSGDYRSVDALGDEYHMTGKTVRQIAHSCGAKLPYKCKMQRQRAEQMIRDGYASTYIAKSVGLDASTIRKYRKRLGLSWQDVPLEDRKGVIIL